MSINAIDGRIVEKVSTIASEVPTIGPSFDHTDGTWIPTDVYEAEFFVNVTDKKLYMLMNGTIVEIGTSVSASTLAAVLAAGNIMPTDETITNTSGDANISLGTTTNPDDIDLVTTEKVHIKGQATGTTKEVNMEAGYIEIKYTDGSNITKTQYSDTSIITSSTDGTNNSELLMAPIEFKGNTTDGNIINEIYLNGNNINMKTINSSASDETFHIIKSDQSLIKSNDSINSMEMAIEPTQVYIQDQTATIFFKVNNVGVVLPEFFTPTSSADTTGVQGQLTLDNNYIYVKTATGWKRSALSSF